MQGEVTVREYDGPDLIMGLYPWRGLRLTSTESCCSAAESKQSAAIALAQTCLPCADHRNARKSDCELLSCSEGFTLSPVPVPMHNH